MAEHTALLLSAAFRQPNTMHRSSTMAGDSVMPIDENLVSKCKTRLHRCAKKIHITAKFTC